MNANGLDTLSYIALAAIIAFALWWFLSRRNPGISESPQVTDEIPPVESESFLEPTLVSAPVLTASPDNLHQVEQRLAAMEAMLDKLAAKEVTEPAVEEPASPPPPQDTRTRIYALLDDGLTAEAIAQQLQVSRDEVELCRQIRDLRRQTSPAQN